MPRRSPLASAAALIFCLGFLAALPAPAHAQPDDPLRAEPGLGGRIARRFTPVLSEDKCGAQALEAFGSSMPLEWQDAGNGRSVAVIATEYVERQEMRAYLQRVMDGERALRRRAYRDPWSAFLRYSTKGLLFTTDLVLNARYLLKLNFKILRERPELPGFISSRGQSSAVVTASNFSWMVPEREPEGMGAASMEMSDPETFLLSRRTLELLLARGGGEADARLCRALASDSCRTARRLLLSAITFLPPAITTASAVQIETLVRFTEDTREGSAGKPGSAPRLQVVTRVNAPSDLVARLQAAASAGATTP